jgi:hypothetical protein
MVGSLRISTHYIVGMYTSPQLLQYPAQVSCGAMPFWLHPVMLAMLDTQYNMTMLPPAHQAVTQRRLRSMLGPETT